MNSRNAFAALAVLMMAMALLPISGMSQELPPDLPAYLHDRGTGIPMSQNGTYVRSREVLLYPFYEYYHDHNMEYRPEDFGYNSGDDFRGKYTANEGIMFLGYGISDRLALEFEAAYISAKLTKSEEDHTAMPAQIDESGLGDVEGQLRWRWNHETASTPEFFSFVETVFPTGKDQSLIGTSAWEFAFQTGLIKGYHWGTITPRLGFEYATEDNSFGVAYALEYLKRVSNRVRFFAMVEGFQGDAAVVPEIQWHFSPHAFLKTNVGIGITSKETDIAPEVGVMFAF